MSSVYTRKKIKVLRERARLRAIRGWESRRKNGTDTWGSIDEPRPLPEGEFLGVLQWHDSSGEVKRMTILQGKRANSIRVRGMRKDHGWDYVLRKLREKLSIQRRIFA